MKPFIDSVVDRFLSKKLTVLIIACLFLYIGKIAGDHWIQIAMAYLAGQSVIDTFKAR